MSATPLAEQQRLLRAALAVLEARPVLDGEHIEEVTVDWLRDVIRDHEDPEVGCLAGARDCVATRRARRILAGEA